MYHKACEMAAGICAKAAEVPGEAGPDAPACPGLPEARWEGVRADNVQERANREIKRRSRVARVFPSTASPGRLAGAVMCGMGEARPEARGRVLLRG